MARPARELPDITVTVAAGLSSPYSCSAFGSDTSAAVLVDRTGTVVELPILSKRELADRILDRVLALRPTAVPC
jgi:phosphopantothenoylcysteine synthetase/decarboxylase